MKFVINILASVLLLFNGIGALLGGWILITHPDGSAMHLSLDLLKFTPFQDFLIPGIILFIVNGIFSMIAFRALIRKYKYAYWLILAQGVILSGWIVIQILLIRTIHPLHILLIVIGIALIFLGFICRKCNSLNVR
ncbi:MAG: hypothetical protein WAO52_07590 [Prolixibacteraceae bacterium]